MAKVRCQCPKCSQAYLVDDSGLGKSGTCRKCGQTFVLQAAATPQPTAATPPPAPARERPRGPDGILLDWEPGDVILDLYEVRPISDKKPHAQGGMGRVNRLWHRQWQTDLAVKSVLPAKLKHAHAVDNFKTEAEEWVNKIGLHPNVVSCHYVRVLGGSPRVFIDYVDGGSLAEWISTGRLYEGSREAALARMLDVAIQFAWGLDYVHGLGMVHQDVKPDNVMMTASGVAKVTDFGIARARAVAGEEPTAGRPGQSLLVPGVGLCTKQYASPEQMKKESLTRRSDLWSWAVSVLEMFLGERKWDLGPAAPLSLNQAADDATIPHMPEAVRELLQRCLQRRVEDRPHDLRQVAGTLQSIYQQVTGQPYPREQPKPDDLLADSLNNRAVSLMDLQKQEAAEKKWREALGVDPHHPEATYNWSLIQWRSARMTDQKLLQKLREVRTSSSDAARVDYLVGLVHLESTDAQAAVHTLSKAVEGGAVRAEIASALALAQSLADPSEQLPRTFEGHTSFVYSVSWSPDGRCALSGSWDDTLRLWELSSGKCLRTFEGHTDHVTSVSWSPDGRFALSGSTDQTLRLWDVSSGKCLRSFEGHTERVNSVSWTPDGRFALSGSWDNTLRLWEVSSGKCLRTFEGHTDDVNSVSRSPDGRFALSGSTDKTLRLWDVSSGKCLRSFEGHTERVTSVSWSPDGRFALSGSRDNTLRLWELSSGECLRTFDGHTGDVTSVSWSPDGRFALSGSDDITLRLWEVSSGKCLRTFRGHTSFVYSVSWSPDGRFALSGSTDKTLRLWGIAFAKQPIPLVPSMAFAAGSTEYRDLLQHVRDKLTSNPAVAADFLQQARQQPGCSRREDALELARQLSRSLTHRNYAAGWEKRTFEGHTAGLTSVSWSPDGRFALSGSTDQTLRLWDVSSGKCLRSFEGHSGDVNSVSWSPDGRCALSGSDDKTLRLWDVSSGQCLRSFEGPRSWVDWVLQLWEVFSGTSEGYKRSVNSVSWSPDGRCALSASSDKTLRLWEVSSGKCLRTFKRHRGRVNSVSWSPDGRCALSASSDHTLRLWDVSSGKCLRSFEGHTSSVHCVSWSPDGRFALSGSSGISRSSDKTLRLWEVSSGKCLRTFEGSLDWLTSVSWSSDGRFALSGSYDKTLRLWEVSSGKLLRTFEGHTAGAASVSWSFDGRFALSGSYDKTLRLWELDWEFESNKPTDWDEGARPFLNAFLTLHTPYVNGMVRRGKPAWTEDDFRRLLETLGCAGYGWLRPEGVRRELEKMAERWKGPPPMPGKPRAWLNWLFGR